MVVLYCAQGLEGILGMFDVFALLVSGMSGLSLDSTFQPALLLFCLVLQLFLSSFFFPLLLAHTSAYFSRNVFFFLSLTRS